MTGLQYVGTVLRFSITGKPIAWARAGRVVGKLARTYTPNKQAAHMQTVKFAALAAMKGRRTWYDAPVEIEVTSFFVPAKSWAKWKRDAATMGTFPHTQKPDADNLVKIIKDALTGVVWRDDAQVVDVISRKRYGDVARTEIVVRSILRV